VALSSLELFGSKSTLSVKACKRGQRRRDIDPCVRFDDLRLLPILRGGRHGRRRYCARSDATASGPRRRCRSNDGGNDNNEQPERPDPDCRSPHRCVPGHKHANKDHEGQDPEQHESPLAFGQLPALCAFPSHALHIGCRTRSDECAASRRWSAPFWSGHAWGWFSWGSPRKHRRSPLAESLKEQG
jgi:hypothetical protein